MQSYSEFTMMSIARHDFPNFLKTLTRFCGFFIVIFLAALIMSQLKWTASQTSDILKTVQHRTVGKCYVGLNVNN